MVLLNKNSLIFLNIYLYCLMQIYLGVLDILKVNLYSF